MALSSPGCLREREGAGKALGRPDLPVGDRRKDQKICLSGYPQSNLEADDGVRVQGKMMSVLLTGAADEKHSPGAGHLFLEFRGSKMSGISVLKFHNGFLSIAINEIRS